MNVLKFALFLTSPTACSGGGGEQCHGPRLEASHPQTRHVEAGARERHTPHQLVGGACSLSTLAGRGRL